MTHECKRCLLLEAGESVTYDEIMSYVSTIDKKELVDANIFDYRISQCKQCDYLIAGMCRKCGCYVEVRARLKNVSCPNFDDRRW
jgi:predicted Zn-ribbon and HTH transcriptional regulator